VRKLARFVRIEFGCDLAHGLIVAAASSEAA
jgi:hypothetical protein